MVANTKIVQSAINRLAEILQEMDKVVVLRLEFIAANPDVTGTPLEGNKAAVSQLLNDIETLAGSAVTSAVKAAVVSSHRGKAL